MAHDNPCITQENNQILKLNELQFLVEIKLKKKEQVIKIEIKIIFFTCLILISHLAIIILDNELNAIKNNGNKAIKFV